MSSTAAKTHIRVYEEDKFRIEKHLQRWKKSRVAKNQPEAVKHLLDLIEAQEKERPASTGLTVKTSTAK